MIAPQKSIYRCIYRSRNLNCINESVVYPPRGATTRNSQTPRAAINCYAWCAWTNRCEACLPALLISAALAYVPAHAQDMRRVTEPKIPASCAVLTARLASVGVTLAESDESKPDTGRIQLAMDRCKPGQAVELKAGGGHDAFLTGPLELRRGVTLLVDKGVILFGSRNPRDYDVVPGLCGTVTEKKYPYTQGISGHDLVQAADWRGKMCWRTLQPCNG